MLSLFKRHPATPSPELSQILSEFNRSLMLIADKSLMIRNFIVKIKQICAVEIVHLFLLDEGTGRYRPQGTELPPSLSLGNDGKLISWLSVNERPLLLPKHPDIMEYLTQEERTMLDRLQVELIYPMKVMNKINGVIFVGKQTGHPGFKEDELNLLSLLINQAAFAIEHASLYETQAERVKKMYRADRLATLGELAAGAAHEIRNPLTAIRSTIQYLSKDFSDDAVKSGMITELISEVERINKIVQGLLSFARPTALNTAEIDLGQLVNQTLLLIGNALRKQGIEVEYEYFIDNPMIRADAEQLKQVCLNLLLNAVEAMSQNPPDKPRSLIISIEPGGSSATGQPYLLLSFEDTGRGIEEKDLDHIYNPFFTTKEEGTGLGLAICYGIINHHGGEIEVRATPGKGTCFTIKLPR